MAANVPFAARRRRPRTRRAVGSHRTPPSCGLPPRGHRRSSRRWLRTQRRTVAPCPERTPTYPEAELPLRLSRRRDLPAMGAQVRPDQPLAQYQLRARIQRATTSTWWRHFGASRPSRCKLDAAQRQLDGLVIRSGDAQRHEARRQHGQCGGGCGDRPHVRVRHDVPGRSLRAEDSCALRRRRGPEWAKLPYVVAASGRLGRAPDGPAERAGQLARVDHGRVPYRVDHRRQRV